MSRTSNDREHQAVWPPRVTLPREVCDMLAIEDEDWEWRQELRAERCERMRGLISVAMVAGALGVSRHRVRWLIRHEGLPCVIFSPRRTMVPEDEFNEWRALREDKVTRVTET